jgi:prolyl-tRNA synthetase
MVQPKLWIFVRRDKWARGGWAGSDEDKVSVKEATGATLCRFPFVQPDGPHVCFMTRQPAEEVAIFTKAY